MKKTILLAVAIVAISTVSCKKERTCDCKTATTDVTTVSGGGSSTTSSSSTQKYTVEKMSKKYARRASECQSKKEETTSTGTGYTTVTTDVVTCEFK